jgi:hypothetical protein
MQVAVFVSEEGSDAERVDLLTGFLRGELLTVDAVEVSTMRADQLPPGARGIDAAAVGGLIVGLGRWDAAIRSVIRVIRRWLDRSPHEGRSVRIEIEGDVLVLSDASRAEESRLVNLFIRRHSDGEGKSGGRRAQGSDRHE